MLIASYGVTAEGESHQNHGYKLRTYEQDFIGRKIFTKKPRPATKVVRETDREQWTRKQGAYDVRRRCLRKSSGLLIYIAR